MVKCKARSKEERARARETDQTGAFLCLALSREVQQKQNKTRIQTDSGAPSAGPKPAPLALPLAASLPRLGPLIVIFFPPPLGFCSFEVRKCQWFLSSVFGQDSFFKSRSRKRPFSLSRSLPEIQTSSQKTASHPIHSARGSALGQEISGPFRFYKNLQNWI